MNRNTAYCSAAEITPSARPSLRGYSSRLRPARENMGRYGIAGSEQSDDRDEVDNVLSKPINPQSPTLRRHDLSKRRKSFNSSQELNISESTEAHLSKSLPTSLSYYCSDDEELQSFEQIHQAVNRSDSNNLRNRSNSLQPESFNWCQSQHESRIYAEEAENKNNRMLWAISGITIICIAFMLQYLLNSGIKTISYDLKTELNKLRSRYKITDDSFLRVHSGIRTVSHKDYAASFIFLYDTNRKGFNEEVFHDFVNEISYVAANYLRNDSAGVRPVEVRPGDLAHSQEQLVRRYERPLAASGVLLVRDLAAVPADRAMAFHYYCDEYNPLVKRSAVFFTLDLAKCDNYHGQKDYHSIVEKCLKTLWKSLPQHNIGPLLTRVVNVLIDVTEMV